MNGRFGAIHQKRGLDAHVLCETWMRGEIEDEHPYLTQNTVVGASCSMYRPQIDCSLKAQNGTPLSLLTRPLVLRRLCFHLGKDLPNSSMLLVVIGYFEYWI